MKKIFLVILVSLLTFACTSEQKEVKKIKEIEQIKEEKKQKKLIFEIELKTSKPDDFALSSNDIFLSNKQSMNIRITQKIKVSEEFQKVHFEFPENIVIDDNLVFSLGNKVEKEIKIQNVLLEFGNIQYKINPLEVKKYFGFNKFVEYNPENGTLLIKKIDNKLNPIMRLKQKYLLKFSQE